MKGFPDFFLECEDYIIVCEAKADNESSSCEEVQFYMTHNKLKKDVVGIAISGQTEKTYIAHLYFRIGKKNVEIETNHKLLPLDEIKKRFLRQKYGEFISTENLVKTIKSLNENFQNTIKDTERSLFFAGIMIALKDNTFIGTYNNIQPPTKEERQGSKTKLLESHNLNEAIIQAISRQIENKVNNLSKEYNWRDRFSFIKNVDFQLKEYKKTISLIENKIFRPFTMDEKQDILGRAYKIFLSRAGKIENKNIILTPDHIKALMIELARLTTTDVVIDTCTGSGGFLMEAMEDMTEKAKNDPALIKKIQNHNLIGFENDPTLFSLACSNMFLHGDGRTNLIFGSSLLTEGNEDDDIILKEIQKMNPSKCIINPPYENNLPILFTKQALDFLGKQGKLIIIMPTPTLNRNSSGLTRDILNVAKLDFVIKMPNNLFSEQGRTVNTSIFGFTKTPHNQADKVIFYNMDDDGLVSVQHKGRIDKNGKWEKIRTNVIRCINHNDDVAADYSKRVIYDNGILNCYGMKEQDTFTKNPVKVKTLFNHEFGALQSSKNNIDGDYSFITAAEEWKRHDSYDHDCEAIVYAVQAGGSLGRSHYVKGKFIASDLCLILTPNREMKDVYPVNLRFYSLYLNAMRKYIVNELADGTSKLTINADDFMEYYIEYINIEKQDNIANEYNKKIEKLKQKLDNEKIAFNRKLQDLM